MVYIKSVDSHCRFSCNCIDADDADDASDVSLKVLSFMEHKMGTRVRAAEILLYTFDNGERGVKHAYTHYTHCFIYV